MKEKRMLTEKPILQAVSASLVVPLSLAAKPLRAQSDAEPEEVET
jgi:hypothetical protein